MQSNKINQYKFIIHISLTFVYQKNFTLNLNGSLKNEKKLGWMLTEKYRNYQNYGGESLKGKGRSCEKTLTW